ncbi:DUF1648 domain-containing protein [Enterococcus gilvus]|uniref:DUF1648 domain-containing protein n=1 Tax=Enterococcus gilvus TaxID=160453 RepID=UPI0028D58E2A|nr:DUF1648 domain-containing protein [Enterococcus gilvus]
MKKVEITIMCSKSYRWIVHWLPKITIVLSILLFAVSLISYPTLPNVFPTHINILGQADAFGGKTAIFMFPMALFALGLGIKTIDRQYNSFYFTSVMILLTICAITVTMKMYLTYV